MSDTMMMSRVPKLSASRILVRGVNWLGDAVMTTPALIRLREAYPEAHLALLTPEKLADLWRHHPALNEVIPFVQGDSPWRVAAGIRDKQFDLGIVFPNSPRSALEVWFARIPQRVGFARPWRTSFLTKQIRLPQSHRAMHKRTAGEIRHLIEQPDSAEQTGMSDSFQSHHVHHYLHLVGAVGASTEAVAPLLRVTDDEVANFKYRVCGQNSPAIGLIPGAEYGPAKRWPAEGFVAVAREVNRALPHCWVVFGGRGDAATAAMISDELSRAGVHCINLAGATSLRDLCAGLKACRAVLTNDTGPMHVAAAVGTPVVALFGSTDPFLTAPGLPGDTRHHLLRARVPCAPCFLRECPIDFRCMKSIAPAQVSAALMEVAKRRSIP